MGRPCILIAHPSPDLYGADRVMLETVRGFVAAGWRVVVTMPDDDGPLTALLKAEHAEVVVCPTVVLRRAYLSGFGAVRLLWLAARSSAAAVRLLRQVRPDVVWVNTITVPLWALLARVTRRSVVTHAHEAEDGPVLVRRALAAPLSLANVVVANSDATACCLERDGIALKRKLRRIYNGVDGPSTRAATVAPAPDRSPLKLLFVGRLSERKGPDVLIEMLGSLIARGHDATLELVGTAVTGYESYERTLHDRAASLGLTDRIRFSGYQSPVWSAFARSDIAFAPSRLGESLGNTAIEAMLSGVPVVVSRVQGLSEVAGDGRFAALVEPDDPDALVRCVESLLADWPATQTRAQTAYVSALERFSTSSYQAAVVAVGEQLRTS